MAIGQSHINRRNTDQSSTAPFEALVTVYADDDGVATFLAVRGLADVAQHLALDCQGEDGTGRTYPVDLSLAATFLPLTLKATQNLRPALTGDPTSYSQGDLIRAGYGLRPDPRQLPNLYAAWLDSATRSAKRRISIPGRTGPAKNIQDHTWGGPVLHAASTKYVAAFAYYTAPVVFPWSNTAASIWGGLGGAGGFLGTADQTIIQAGVEFDSQTFGITTYAWKEYYANNNRNCQGGGLCPVPLNFVGGDSIRTASWACDSAGNVNPNGGYGCFWLVNPSSNPQQILNCVTPTDRTCPSVAASASYLGLMQSTVTASESVQYSWLAFQ